METDKNKSNKKFMILSFFGILMVVSGHILNGNPIDLFGNFFPINSFFMPMFIFISGYFFKDEYLYSFKKFFWKKTKRLLIYYLIWNIAYAILMKVLFKIGATNFNIQITLKTIFLEPFIDGQQFVLNSPAWFIPTLYTVEILYWFIRRISKNKIFNIIVLIVFGIISALSVKIAEMNDNYREILPLIKIMFFMFFYILGHYYKIYFERIDKKINPILMMITLMIVNSIILKFNPNIHFSSLFSMAGFKNVNIIIPILTGITGIWFFTKLSELLEESLKNNKIVNLISNNTKHICMHHVFCMYCLSIVIYLLNIKFKFNGYDANLFKNTTGWYFYYFGNISFSIIYCIVGIFGSILIHKMLEKVCKFIKGKIKWKKLKLPSFLGNH